jgi:N-acetylmuramoyl-L-alanine amidase
MPSVLLNMGYITNSIDNQLLDANLEAYAKAIGNAIISGATELGVTAENGSRLWDGQLLSNKKSTEDKPAETESKPDESSESEDSSQLDEDGDTQDGYGEYDAVDYDGDTQVESEPDIVYTDDGMGYYTDPMTTE